MKKMFGLRCVTFLFPIICLVHLSAWADTPKSQSGTVNESTHEGIMDQNSMEAVVKAMAVKSEGEAGFIQFEYQDLNMYLISDVAHDRMRIISPVINYEKLKPEHLEAILISNFHLALDARYALSNGVLYAAYVHPLATLTEPQLQSAVRQVANLVHSFGTDYSSGELSFGNSKNTH